MNKWTMSLLPQFTSLFYHNQLRSIDAFYQPITLFFLSTKAYFLFSRNITQTRLAVLVSHNSQLIIRLRLTLVSCYADSNKNIRIGIFGKSGHGFRKCVGTFVRNVKIYVICITPVVWRRRCQTRILFMLHEMVWIFDKSLKWREVRCLDVIWQKTFFFSFTSLNIHTIIYLY